MECWPVDKRVQITVMGIERSTGDKADGDVIDDIQIIEEIFGGGPVDCITIIWKVLTF